MSKNVGAIYVKASRIVDLPRVRAALERAWAARRAKVDDRPPTSLEALGLEKTKRLGYAIVAPRSGWIGLYDTERYTADFGIAESLAKRLKTEVVVYALYGTTDGAALAVFGKARKSAALPTSYDAVEDYISGRNFPHAFSRFDEVKRTAGAQLVAFSGVRTYDTGPEPKEDEDDVEDEAPSRGGAALRKLARAHDWAGVAKGLAAIKDKHVLHEELWEVLNNLDLTGLKWSGAFVEIGRGLPLARLNEDALMRLLHAACSRRDGVLVLQIAERAAKLRIDADIAEFMANVIRKKGFTKQAKILAAAGR